MSPNDYAPLLNLSLFYSIVVILCADTTPKLQTFLFFTVITLQPILHTVLNYLSKPPSSPPKPAQLTRGMTGLMQTSHGKSKRVRIHEAIGKHHVRFPGKNGADRWIETKMVKLEIQASAVGRRVRGAPRSPHIVRVRTWP